MGGSITQAWLDVLGDLDVSSGMDSGGCCSGTRLPGLQVQQPPCNDFRFPAGPLMCKGTFTSITCICHGGVVGARGGWRCEITGCRWDVSSVHQSLEASLERGVLVRSFRPQDQRLVKADFVVCAPHTLQGDVSGPFKGSPCCPGRLDLQLCSTAIHLCHGPKPRKRKQRGWRV